MLVGAASSQPELETTGRCKTHTSSPWPSVPASLTAPLSRAGGCSPVFSCSCCRLCSRAVCWDCH